MINTLIFYIKFKNKSLCVVGYQLNNMPIYVETVIGFTKQEALYDIIERGVIFADEQVLYDGELNLFIPDAALAAECVQAYELDVKSPRVNELRKSVICEFNESIKQHKEEKSLAETKILQLITRINESTPFFTKSEVNTFKKKII